jgi:hypothetical protein
VLQSQEGENLRGEGLSKDQIRIIESLVQAGPSVFIQQCKKDVNYDPLVYLELIGS